MSEPASAANPPPPTAAGAPPPAAGAKPRDDKAYWRANITFVVILLLIWFTVSCVLSIFAVEWLNQWHLGGFPLGFWMAQQGSVIVFILLILTYAIGMGILDRRYGVEETAAAGGAGDGDEPGADAGAAQ